MLIKRVSFNRLITTIILGWIGCFILISYRMIKTLDRDDDMIVNVINLAKRALIPEIINDQTLWQRSNSKHVPNDLNNIPQMMPPENNIVKQFEGEMNSPVKIEVDKLSLEERKRYDKGWSDHAFNEYASKLISFNRHLPDFRDPECKQIKYKSKLPKASVIIIFHNEAWSTLLRTVHSVLNQSPSQYLEEIILVDDASDKDYLKQPLDDYVNKIENVKLMRMKSRSGLILARIAGSDSATGEAIVFLDSHCEVTTGWLEPLLEILNKNPNASAVPIIETIDDTDLKMHNTAIELIQVGGFTWDLIFNWHHMPEHERKRRMKRIDPIRSPTMAGGLFAIRKDWFEKLGKYDEGMKIWGGENIELSFKLWMCGGELLISPCSHVGHIFRKKSPYKWPKNENVVLRNTMRVALVWLDDYLPNYLKNLPVSKQNPDLYGNITNRLELRKSLNCKNFEYFHKNIYPELFMSRDMIKIGEIRNMGENLCLDCAGKRSTDKVIVFPCHGLLGTQLWYYSPQKEIRKESYCLDYAGGIKAKNKEDKVIIMGCHGKMHNQYWEIVDNKLIRHNSGLCLAVSPEGKLVMTDCDVNNTLKMWKWENNE